MPHFRGISDAHGNMMVVMTHNTDISDAWEREGEDPRFFYQFSPDGYARRHQRDPVRDDALNRSPMPFSSLGLHADLLKGVRELGFLRPTPIQTEAIPAALAGRDVLACAQTGSGKTGGIPAAHPAPTDRPPAQTTRALVLTPTRELAAQILEDLQRARRPHAADGAAVYGGVAMGPQEHAFRSGVDVIVATPGRLLDHFRAPVRQAGRRRAPGARRGRPHARHGLYARYPADPPARCRAQRQTLFFSATMPPPIAR